MKTIRKPEGVESWPLDRILPFARNPKIHGAEQVDSIAASMERFGWTVPCLVAPDGELIAGHGRLLAARRLGLTEAPVIVLPELTAGAPRPAAPAEAAPPREFAVEMRELLTRALVATGGRIYGPEGAAALLGLKPTTLQGKLKKYGVEAPRR